MIVRKLQEAHRLVTRLRKRCIFGELKDQLKLEMRCGLWDRVVQVTFPNELCVVDCRQGPEPFTYLAQSFAYTLSLSKLEHLIQTLEHVFCEHLTRDDPDDDYVYGCYRVAECELDFHGLLAFQKSNRFYPMDWDYVNLL